jgi:beta-galactosidase
VGKTGDGKVACETEVRTAGPAAGIRLTPDRDTVTAAPGEVSLVKFEIVDSAGVVVPGADNLVRFSITGGTIVALDNGDMRDHDPYRSESRRAFNGRGLAILRAAQPGVLRLTAAADGLPSADASVHVAQEGPPPAIPAAR